MKSLKERLADKAAKQAKEDAKLSGPINCFAVRIPWCGAPDVRKDSDLKFLQQRAKDTVAKIRHNAAYQFYDAMRKEMEALENAATSRRGVGIFSREVQPATPPPGTTRITVTLNVNGTLTDDNGNVFSPNSTYPDPPNPYVLVDHVNADGTVVGVDGVIYSAALPESMRVPAVGEALSHTVANNITDVPPTTCDISHLVPPLAGGGLTVEEVTQLESLTPSQRGDDLTPEEEDAILQPGEAPHTITPPTSYVPIEHRTAQELEDEAEEHINIDHLLRTLEVEDGLTQATAHERDNTPRITGASFHSLPDRSPADHIRPIEESRHNEDDPRNPRGER